MSLLPAEYEAQKTNPLIDGIQILAGKGSGH
jgi:hypothetical protein